MKNIEILKIGRNILDLLQQSCIRMDDVRYISLYDEYSSIMKKGVKKSYAVALLSEKYGISERKVYYLLKKFNADCKVDAVSS